MIEMLLFIFITLILPYMSVQGGYAAFCFLSHRPPASEIFDFAEELAQDAVHYGVDVFMMIDDNNATLPSRNLSSKLQILQMSNERCFAHNYRKTMWLYDRNVITSWDKVLFYFSVLAKNYSFLWISEDDTFLPSTQLFRSIHELYANTSDFIVPRVGLNLLGSTGIWHYGMASGKLLPPWACSMVNFIGLSRRMLTTTDQYIQWLGEVPFHEFFFNTLAIQFNLTVVAPPELRMIVHGRAHKLSDLLRNPNTIWHPVKHSRIQKHWRAKLSQLHSRNATQMNLTSIENLCENIENLTHLNQTLRDFIWKFQIVKIYYSANERCLLRDRFSSLAHQCQMQNMSKEIISLITALADHAYKLPELPVENLTPAKSSYHLQLEQAIRDNRQAIGRLLPSNSSKLGELRNQTSDFIKQLTAEIQREYVNKSKQITNRSRKTMVQIKRNLFRSTQTSNGNTVIPIFISASLCVVFFILKNRVIPSNLSVST